MRARGKVALLLLLACAACTDSADVAPLPSEFQARLGTNAAAFRLCDEDAAPLAQSGGHPRLAWILVRTEPPEDARRIVECHYDVDGYPAPMPPPLEGEEPRSYRRVVIQAADGESAEVLSAAFDRRVPDERPGTRLIRIDPAEEG